MDEPEIPPKCCEICAARRFDNQALFGERSIQKLAMAKKFCQQEIKSATVSNLS